MRDETQADAEGLFGVRGPRASLRSTIVSIAETWRRRARDRKQLAELDSRMLRDLGLNRADVSDETAKPFWKS